MTSSASAKSAIKLTKSKFPRCLRCDKWANALTIREDPYHPGKVVVEYCHEEGASQEMSPSELASGRGLASYTAFNAYTSGPMLRESPNKSSKKRGGKR